MPTKAALLRYAQLGAIAWAAASLVVAWLAVGGALLGPLDLLNQGAPAWFAAALVGAVAGWLPLEHNNSRLRAVGAFALAAATHAALIAPEFARHIPAAVSPAADAPRVRIVWLNAQSGTADESVTRYLLSTNADFIMMSEFHTEADMVTPALGQAYPFYTTCDEPHACNVIVLSRQAPLATRPEHEVSATELRVVWAEYAINGAPLRLVATHLQRPYPAARQAGQRAELVGVLEAGAPENTILAGDLNATPWSFALRSFDTASGLTRYDRAMPTWPATTWTRLRLPAPEAFMPLDHVYAGANWRLASIRRGPRTGADHFPIEAEFVWVGEQQ